MRWGRPKRVYVDDLGKTHDFRFGIIFTVAIAAVLGCLYAVAGLVVGDKLPGGTAIGGVDVGGMTEDAARTKVQAELALRVIEPITVKTAGKSFRVVPQDAGLTLDIDTTIADAMDGGRWSPQHLVNVVVGGSAHEPTVDVDRVALRATMGKIRAAVSRPASGSRITFDTDGQPAVTVGEDGQTIDVGAAEVALREALIAGRGSVTLPLEATTPPVTAAEAEQFLSNVAQPAVARSISLRVRSHRLVVRPPVFGPTLSADATDGNLALHVDGSRLLDRVSGLLMGLPGSPKDAHFSVHGTKVVIVSGRSGLWVRPDDLAKSVEAAIVKSGKDRVATVPAVRRGPSRTIADLSALRVRSLVRAYHSAFASTPFRAANVRRAVSDLNGTIITPGSVVSLNAAIGPTTADRGFRVSTRAPEATLQGDVSFVASVFSVAAFNAGLGRVEQRHSTGYDERFPVGLDANVVYGSDDLRLRNDTPFGIWVRAYPTGPAARPTVHVELWSSPYWKVRASRSPLYNVRKTAEMTKSGPSCEARKGTPGFTVNLTQSLFHDGRLVRTVPWPTRYPPRPPVTCRR